MSLQRFIILALLNGIVLGITTELGSWQWVALVVWTGGLVGAAVSYGRSTA